MKTADLIPLVLLELNEGDKYGFELTKSIETKSNGKIVIKQPTLYTLLKKLEKSKFISSYWEDSEIGGKRHYYKLTQNGKLQIYTLPSYEDLILHALQNENDEITETPILDSFPSTLPEETILPSNEIFTENGIDNATEIQLNTTNSEILKTDEIVADLNFATNENVMKFSEKLTSNYSAEKPEIKIEPIKTPTIDIKVPMESKDDDIKFVNYVNFKHSKEYKESQSICKKLLLTSIISSAIIILVSLSCLLITQFTGRSALFYVILIIALTISLFHPILVGLNLENLRIKYQNEPYKQNIKMKLCFSILLLATTLITCFIVNLTSGNNSISDIFIWNNFANLYAPLLISSASFINVITNQILMKNHKK